MLPQLDRRGIYYIRDETTYYIGKTTRSFAIRFSEHLTALRENKHANYKLQAAYDTGATLICGVLCALEDTRKIEILEEVVIEWCIGYVPLFNLEGVTQFKYSTYRNRNE
jgi:hypothetical protein